MNTPNLYLEITDGIITKEQADDFIVCLEELTDSIFDTKSDISDKLSRFLPFDKKRIILNICQKNNVDINNPENMQDFLTGLKAYIKKLPVIQIEIACDLNNLSLNNISNWFNINIKQKALIDITVNKKIIGGIMIGSNGIYKDYSLRGKLEKKYAGL